MLDRTVGWMPLDRPLTIRAAKQVSCDFSLWTDSTALLVMLKPPKIREEDKDEEEDGEEELADSDY